MKRGAGLLGICALVLLSALPAHAAQAGQPGMRNDITDVQGVVVSTYSKPGVFSGSSLVYFPNRATGGYDVRGGAPTTRETDLMDPVNEVQHVNAFLLTGGGDLGLSVGPGVMQDFYSKGIGFQVGFTDTSQVVPILPGAAVNDLARGGPFSAHPDYSYGAPLTDAAVSQGNQPNAVEQGNVGAGLGAVAGGIKGGVGSASQLVTGLESIGSSLPAGVTLPTGMMVGAYVVVDSVGAPVDLATGCTLIGTQLGLAGEFSLKRPAAGCGGYTVPSAPQNSVLARGGVIGVVATNVNLDKTFAKKFAAAGSDGLLLALNSTHTMFDSDIMFGASTGVITPAVGAIPDCVHAEVSLSGTGCLLLLNALLQAASDTVSRAVAHAVLAAKSVPGIAQNYCDTFAGACSGSGSGAGGTGAAGAPTHLGGSRVPAAAPHTSPARSLLPRGLSQLAVLGALVLVLALLSFGRLPRFRPAKAPT